MKKKVKSAEGRSLSQRINLSSSLNLTNSPSRTDYENIWVIGSERLLEAFPYLREQRAVPKDGIRKFVVGAIVRNEEGIV